MAQTVLITCGPASEPIDQVRRITNFSTGELGVRLAEKMAVAGWRVICCKGSAATWPHPPAPCETRLFGSNADLQRLLEQVQEPVAAVYHVAALGDFTVAEVHDAKGNRLAHAKIPSTEREIFLKLIPSPKILPRLRQLWPHAQIIAWKYELDGTRDEALERGRRQTLENQADACVINGAAYGAGFGLLTQNGTQHYSSKNALCDALVALATQTKDS